MDSHRLIHEIWVLWKMEYLLGMYSFTATDCIDRLRLVSVGD